MKTAHDKQPLMEWHKSDWKHKLLNWNRIVDLSKGAMFRIETPLEKQWLALCFIAGLWQLQP